MGVDQGQALPIQGHPLRGSAAASPAGGNSFPRRLTLVVDQNGFLKSYSMVALAAFGLESPGGSLGINVLELIVPQERGRAVGELNGCLKCRTRTVHRFTVQAGPGRPIPVLIECEPQRHAGRVQGIIMTLHRL